MASVLACGPDAALSHLSAASRWSLLASSRAVVDVTTPTRAGRPRRGIDVHSGATLQAGDITIVDRIPTTSVARTLLDLAGVVDRRRLERACEQAEVLRIFDLRAIEDVLARANGHRGTGALRAVLAEHAIATTHTRSALEERLLALCRSASLPRPEVNAWIALRGGGGFEADFLWREQRLDVETDGRAVHGTRRAFERDRRRDQRLLAEGWRAARFTWHQIVGEPAVVVGTLRALLASPPLSGSRGSGRAPAPRRARA